LEAYARVLTTHGINTNFVLDRAPTKWNGASYEPESKNLKVLIVGRSFFVADQFEFFEALTAGK
jgi:hypothetical protein